MDLSDKLTQLEAAQAELLNTVNRVAILNCLLRELGMPVVSLPQLGMAWARLEESQYETAYELSRRACVGVTA